MNLSCHRFVLAFVLPIGSATPCCHPIRTVSCRVLDCCFRFCCFFLCFLQLLITEKCCWFGSSLERHFRNGIVCWSSSQRPPTTPRDTATAVSLSVVCRFAFVFHFIKWNAVKHAAEQTPRPLSATQTSCLQMAEGCHPSCPKNKKIMQKIKLAGSSFSSQNRNN